jgi:endonuclease YncB( thermonuclease family)
MLASILGTFLVGASLLAATPAHALGADLDCGDFATQAQAQEYFLAIGGPSADPDRLDLDSDGVACETRPCPCSTSSVPSAPPAPPAPPAPAAPRCTTNPKLTERAVVESVIDGDTLRVRIDGKRTKVRLLGINSPERHRKGYDAATKALRKLTPPKKIVMLASDPTQPDKDHYGRLLRYVKHGSRDANRTQLAKGWARFYDARTCAPLTKRKAYLRAERSAKNAHRGIWS